MAFFDEQELIDQIRHELRMEDDSGTCARVVAQERRRAKHGGLPLNFRMATSSDDEDEYRDDSYDYEIPLFEDPVHTREIVESRLRSRTDESVDALGSQTNLENRKSSDELFVSKEVGQAKKATKKISAVSKFINESGASMDNPLLSYARFEAVGDQPSKSILVLFDVADEIGGIPRIQISVKPSAKVGDVIGYCLYRLYTDFEKIVSGTVDDYQLLMADDCGEIELDLPPLDRARSIGDLGFTVLALVSKRRNTDEDEKSTYRIVVYLPSGQNFIFELEHIDYTLEWLRDEAVKRKQANEVAKRHGLMPGSRGEFHPRGTMFRQKSTALLTPISRPSNSPLLFDFSTTRQSPDGTTSCTPSGSIPTFVLSDEEEVILSFRINRIHRVKRNWPGILSIRWDLFDIAPLPSNRKSFFPNSYQKVISVPWTHLCAVKCLERTSGEPMPMLAITWLPVLAKEAVPSAEDINLRHIAQFYEHRTWKIVTVEFESVEKAQQAREHMVDVVKALNSPAFQAYQHSHSGSKSPSDAAEAVLMEMADGLLPVSSDSPKALTLRKLIKLRKAFTSKKS